MTGHEEVPPRRGIARWLYETLLRQIEHGVWPNGHPLPSEDDLEFYPTRVWLHGLPPSEEELKKRKEKKKKDSRISKTTIRIALQRLAETGRVITNHGIGTSAYMPSLKPHWLVVDLPKPSFMGLAAVAEPDCAETHPAVALIPADGSEISTRWHEGEYMVPEWESELLGIDTGTKLHFITLILSIGGKPILISTSFVPSDLLGGPVTWQEKPPIGEPALDVGKLALAGASVAFDNLSIDSRPPTLDESELLKPVSGIPVPVYPVYAVYRQCQVTPARRVPAISGRACVKVVIRADLVHL